MAEVILGNVIWDIQACGPFDATVYIGVAWTTTHRPDCWSERAIDVAHGQTCATGKEAAASLHAAMCRHFRKPADSIFVAANGERLAP